MGILEDGDDENVLFYCLLPPLETLFASLSRTYGFGTWYRH